jgi:ubiquinone/menaquinone biosynthesis C-methylase UbiE
VDLAENLLELARRKAKQRGLKNLDFRAGDMLNLGLPEASFDAVVCVFGIFFVPDMPAAVGQLWRLVRPGGTLAITTWGPRFFEPASIAEFQGRGIPSREPKPVSPCATHILAPSATAGIGR